jgi:hypothetical protein
VAQSTSSRRCSDSVSNVRVQQTKNGRRSNVARDPLQTIGSQCAKTIPGAGGS